MSAPQGDPEIELYAALFAVIVAAGFAALFVYLACS